MEEGVEMVPGDKGNINVMRSVFLALLFSTHLSYLDEHYGWMKEGHPYELLFSCLSFNPGSSNIFGADTPYLKTNMLFSFMKE